jgi:hypothetical protein
MVMRDQIASCFGFRIDTYRLEPEECGELLALHEKAIAREGWEPDNFTQYGLASRLSKSEQKRGGSSSAGPLAASTSTRSTPIQRRRSGSGHSRSRH